MSSNIILNKTHIIGNKNNHLRYEFNKTHEFTTGDTLAVSHLNIYYSWFNITSKYNNNKFQYKWFNDTIDGEPTDIYDVFIPDGYYSIDTLNEFLIKKMVENKTYLKTSDGNNMYFIEFLTNSTYYAVEIRISSLSAGITDVIKPDGATWTISETPKCPIINILSNNNFGELIGFNPGMITEVVAENIEDNLQYSFLNNFSPNLEPSSSYILTCSMIDNNLSIPNDTLTSFSIPNNVGFGDLISLNSDVIYSKIKPGLYKDINIKIYDQNHNPLQILDPNMLIVLSVIKH